MPATSHRASLVTTVTLATACCVAAAVALCTGGCGGSRRSWPNVGTYTFLSGEFTGCVHATLDRTVEAAEEALREWGLEPKVRRREKSAELRVMDSDDREVMVRLSAVGEDQCCVRIVMGAVGDEDRSAELFQAIRSGL